MFPLLDRQMNGLLEYPHHVRPVRRTHIKERQIVLDSELKLFLGRTRVEVDLVRYTNHGNVPHHAGLAVGIPLLQVFVRDFPRHIECQNATMGVVIVAWGTYIVGRLGNVQELIAVG